MSKSSSQAPLADFVSPEASGHRPEAPAPRKRRRRKRRRRKARGEGGTNRLTGGRRGVCLLLVPPVTCTKLSRRRVKKAIRKLVRQAHRTKPPRDESPESPELLPPETQVPALQGDWMDNDRQASDDIRLAERAITNRWPTSLENRQQILTRILERGLDTLDAKVMVMCGEFVLKAERQNQLDDHERAQSSTVNAVQNNIQIYIPHNGRDPVGSVIRE